MIQDSLGDSTDSQTAIGAIRVLVVDDHASMREVLTDMLRSYPGVEVIGEGANGREAILLAKQRQPDVILMDITMPKLDGIEATRQIKQAHPKIIVIGLSVHQGGPVELAMMEAGASVFINKEAAVDRLYETMMKLWHDQHLSSKG
ncbi:hypothetical protein W02_26550 [Nitrospira sp. KM1]|uniref:response regulator n=1 Tax=Nitrospira sp. KM1 TaxID=1936990 RepID=UPI0013A778ED|nr:response regulator [Nitrospira sp. KM1]BCA55515.1 hypothetical protein W02_26550 [Nitrospira sp. KM1]